MAMALVLLVGFLMGGLVVRMLMLRAERIQVRPHLLDEQYAACTRAVTRHFKRYDTLNLAQLERLMDIRGLTAMRYLEQLERDRLVKLHGHRGSGAFYTRP
jgi:hypothetical protein